MSFTRQVMAKIAPFMKENGYIQMNRVFYRIQNDIAYAVDFLEIEEGLIDTYALAAFKKENKWKYGV